MRALRLSLAGAAISVMVGGLATVAMAQSEEETDDTTPTWSEDLYVLVTSRGEHPPSAWDAESFVGRICEGSVSVDEVEPMVPFPTSEILVAKQAIEAGDTIEPEWLEMRVVPLDVTTSDALRRSADAVGWIAAVDILENQPIMPNLLQSESTEPSE